MTPTLVLARLTIREAGRRRLLWLGLIVSLVFLVIYGLGFQAIESNLPPSQAVVAGQAHNFLTIAGLYVVNFLLVMMTVLTSVDTVSGEVASGTIHTILSKPVRRWEVLAGKWLGFAAMLSVYLLIMAGGTLGIANAFAGYTPPNVERGVALLWMNCLMLLSVSLLGGSLLSTLANGVLVFGLYGIAFIGGWVEQVGSLLKNDAAVNVGIAASLILPADALWRRAAFEMQSALAGALGVSPFGGSSIPSPAMVFYAGVYALAALALALRVFGRRDL